MNKQNLFLATTLLFLLSFCGDLKDPTKSITNNTHVILPAESEEKLKTDSDSPDEVAEADGEDIFEYSFELIEPEEYGKPWHREVSVTIGGEPAGSVKIYEETGDGKWRPHGFTEEDGIFIDEEIHYPKSYRFSDATVSAQQDAIFDLLITKGTYKKNHLYKAHRVINPKNHVVYIAGFDMIVNATHFIVEGEIRAYHKNCKPGSHAGDLRAKVKNFTGDGLIYLRGCHGANGAKAKVQTKRGANGVPSFYENRANANGKRGPQGHPGADGHRGGSGGDVIIKYESRDFQLSRILNTGGSGGKKSAGGTGGPGGKHDYYYPYKRGSLLPLPGFQPDRWNILTKPSHLPYFSKRSNPRKGWKPGSDGPHGPTGVPGKKDGEPGFPGKYDVSYEPFK